MTRPCRATTRDAQSFEHAFVEHYGGVLRKAMHVLGNRAAAEDVAQEVFSHLWQRPSAYDPDRAPLGAYLRLMAYSRALDVVRHDRTGDLARTRLRPRIAQQDCASEVVDALSEQDLRRQVAALPGAQREAVWATFWKDQTYRETAAASGTPAGTIKSRVRLAVARLRASVDTPPPDA